MDVVIDPDAGLIALAPPFVYPKLDAHEYGKVPPVYILLNATYGR